MIYILIMNVIGFCLMGLDKHRARTRQWRMPEKILFGAALLAAAPGPGQGCTPSTTRRAAGICSGHTADPCSPAGAGCLFYALNQAGGVSPCHFYRTVLRAQKSAALLTPPDGMRETDIALESSTCTGETVIGFRTKADGHLLNAVVVRSRCGY